MSMSSARRVGDGGVTDRVGDVGGLRNEFDQLDGGDVGDVWS
jgi:hypothetical protein